MLPSMCKEMGTAKLGIPFWVDEACKGELNTCEQITQTLWTIMSWKFITELEDPQ